MAADSGALAMVDVATPAATTDVDIPSLDEVTPNASETPAVEETPAEEKSEAETKTEDGKPAAEKSAAEASAPITPKQINAQLQELKKSNEPLAKAIHSHVKQGLESQRFLKEVGAKDFAEAKTLLSKPDEATENFRQAVEQTDEMLYRGDLKELSNNIFEDIKAELGDAAPARLSELSEVLLEKIAEADPEGSTRIQRAQFLAASEASGLIKSLNSLHAFLSEGKVAEAQNLLKSIGTFFASELKEQADIAKVADTKAADTKAAAEKMSATTKALQGEVSTGVNKITNDVMGSFLRPFLSAQLKGVPRTELIKAAEQIRTDLDQTLGKDDAWKKKMLPVWNGLRSNNDAASALKTYEEKLKDGTGKKVVEATLRRLFPQKFTAPPAAPKAPTSTQVTIGGKPHRVFQMEKRPNNLVRSDVELAGRVYTSKELELLQTAKGIGLVPNKSGKGHSFVQWKR